MRRCQQSAIARDQLHRPVAFEREGAKPGIRSVENTQPDLSGACFEQRVAGAVDIDGIALNTHHPGVHVQRIDYPARTVDDTVLYDQGNVVDTIFAR